MFKKMYKKFIRPKISQIKYRSDPESGDNLTPEEHSYIDLTEGCCPDCGSRLICRHQMVAGESQNMGCSNDECRTEINWPWHRNGKMDDARAKFFGVEKEIKVPHGPLGSFIRKD